MNHRALVLDNGACTCKVGWADAEAPSVVAPNATAHQRGVLDTLVADQILNIKNQSTLEFTRPCERGIVTNWPLQVEIWERLIPMAMQSNGDCSASADAAAISAGAVPPGVASSLSKGRRRSGGTSFRDTSLVTTVAPFTPTALTRAQHELVFEHFGFASVSCLPAPCAAAACYAREQQQQEQHGASSSSSSSSSSSPSRMPDEGSVLACCVVDLGYSATYAVPTLRGKAVQGAVRRLNIGGKLLTNYLKEVVSYRQYNMMEETAIINDAKEHLCYVAPTGLEEELQAAVGVKVPAKRSAYREWVLPDYQTHTRGFAKQLRVAADPADDGAPLDERLALEIDQLLGRRLAAKRGRRFDVSAEGSVRGRWGGQA